MNLHKNFLLAIVLFFIFLVGGAFVYSQVEGWRYLDSAYFMVITMTTIGYGNFSPQTDIGKICTMIFSFFGIGMIFYFFLLFGNYLYKKTFKNELTKHHEKLIKNIKLNVSENSSSRRKN